MTFSSDLTVATLTPTSSVVADDGQWTLSLSSQVRDTSGNKLSGDWSGTAAAWTGTFGAVSVDLPGGLGCAVDRGRFVPDGDDGAGGEADTVTLTPVADDVPTWWALAVTDADGTRVRSVRYPGADVTFEWDGRGDDGLVAATGTYLLSVDAVDDAENSDAACAVSVAVAQHVEVP